MPTFVGKEDDITRQDTHLQGKIKFKDFNSNNPELWFLTTEVLLKITVFILRTRNLVNYFSVLMLHKKNRSRILFKTVLK